VRQYFELQVERENPSKFKCCPASTFVSLGTRWGPVFQLVPSARLGVIVSCVEIGAAWRRTSKDNRARGNRRRKSVRWWRHHTN